MSTVIGVWSGVSSRRSVPLLVVISIWGFGVLACVLLIKRRTEAARIIVLAVTVLCSLPGSSHALFSGCYLCLRITVRIDACC